jgi:hypothetical protein
MLFPFVKETSPLLTSSSAMLVCLRLALFASTLGVDPCNSCFARKPATTINRNRESIPGHLPSNATPVEPYCFVSIGLVIHRSFVLFALTALTFATRLLAPALTRLSSTTGTREYLLSRLQKGATSLWPCSSNSDSGSSISEVSFHSDRNTKSSCPSRQLFFGSHLQ